MKLIYVTLFEPRNTPLFSSKQIATWPLQKQKEYAKKILSLCRNQKFNHHLIPKICPYCPNVGFIRIVGHHDDYTKPLRVCFMCFNCHVKQHWPR